MGCWGMGITQSDQYCEIYERFMEEYDRGKPVEDIKNDILYEYEESFEDEDGILHDIYFAIGKAEWMCGGISDDIYKRIAHIIESGENLTFYKELGASESDLKLRKRNLDAFLTSLSLARGKVKKRKIPVEKYNKIDTPKLPVFRAGDVFAYEVNGRYRVLCFTRRMIYRRSYAAFCYVWGKLFRRIPAEDELKDARVMPIGYFTAEDFPDFEKFIYIGNNSDLKRLDIALPKIYKPWKSLADRIATKDVLEKKIPLFLCMKISKGKQRVIEFWKD